MSADPSPRRPVRETWSRTALVGLAGVLAGQLTGSDLVALAGTYAAILGTVAGRAQGPKGGEP